VTYSEVNHVISEGGVMTAATAAGVFDRNMNSDRYASRLGCESVPRSLDFGAGETEAGVPRRGRGRRCSRHEMEGDWRIVCRLP
jgi:hypothetical protein